MLDVILSVLPVVTAMMVIYLILKPSKSNQDQELLKQLKGFEEKIEKLERDVRFEVHESSRLSRQELTRSEEHNV